MTQRDVLFPPNGTNGEICQMFTNSPLQIPCQQPTRLVWDNLIGILMVSSHRKPNTSTNNHSSLYGRLNVKEDKGRAHIRTMFPFFVGLSEKVQRQIHPPHQGIWPVIFALSLPTVKHPIIGVLLVICFGITWMETLQSSLLQNTKKTYLGEYCSTPSPAGVSCPMLPGFPDFKNVHQMPTFFLEMMYNHFSFPRKALI